LAVPILVLLGCAAPIGSAESGLSAGAAAEGDPAVVALTDAADPARVRCTGTLIDARIVLTAAHCGAQADPGALEVFAGSELRTSPARIRIRAAVAHPDDDGSADHDLALLLLEDAPSIAPVPLAAIAPAPGAVRLVGFGVTAPTADDDDRKREGASRIEAVAAGHVVLAGDPSLPCHGDSGGPVLAMTPAGEQLLAVVSRGDEACGARARATRVDPHVAGFIASVRDAWADGGGVLGSSCTGDDDCPGLSCVGPEPTCSRRCTSGRGDCPAGFACEHLGGVDFYCVRGTVRGGGCAASAPAAHAAAWLPPSITSLLALALARARRR
jgi:hypothetical protein